MNRELAVTVSRSWLLGVGSMVAVVALVVGLWAGISLGSPGQASVVAASYDTGSLVSTGQTNTVAAAYDSGSVVSTEQTSTVAAAYDSGSLASNHTATDGFGKVKGAACSGSVED